MMAAPGRSIFIHGNLPEGEDEVTADEDGVRCEGPGV